MKSSPSLPEGITFGGIVKHGHPPAGGSSHFCTTDGKDSTTLKKQKFFKIGTGVLLPCGPRLVGPMAFYTLPRFHKRLKEPTFDPTPQACKNKKIFVKKTKTQQLHRISPAAYLFIFVMV